MPIRHLHDVRYALDIPIGHVLMEEVAHRVNEDCLRRSPFKRFGQLVGNETQIEESIRRVLESYGRIDILVNNAAIDKTVSIEELSVQDWDGVLTTNLRGPFVLSKCVLPIMKRQRSGHIVNIVSTAAKRAWANASAYHASKWGLLGLSHALHVEARPHQVKVTAVVSGGMRTPFLLDRFPDIDLSTLQEPRNVAETIRCILQLPADTAVPEIMVMPMKETSWP